MDFSKVRLLVYDCDGVLTDNRVLVSDDGHEYASFHRGDGLGIRMIKELGIEQIILSTETNPIVVQRGNKLRIPVIYGVENKKSALLSYCQEKGFSVENVLYIGNDINDREAMLAVKLRGCPRDAEPEIQAICDWISEKKGGGGVARDLYRAIAIQRGAGEDHGF